MKDVKNDSIEEMKKLVILNHVSYILWFVAGIVMILLKYVGIDYFASLQGRARMQYDGLSAAFILLGMAGILRMFSIIKKDDKIRKFAVRATDERNIAVANKAKSIAISIAFIAGIILYIVFLPINIAISNAIIYFCCFILFVYLVALLIINRFF